MDGCLGIEPSYEDSKSPMLPLHQHPLACGQGFEPQLISQPQFSRLLHILFLPTTHGIGYGIRTHDGTKPSGLKPLAVTALLNR